MTNESTSTDVLASVEGINLIDFDLRLRLDLSCHHNPVKDGVPFYQFSMQCGKEVVGVIHLRIGDHPSLTNHLGHIGYEVFPHFRGRSYAQRATRLLLPLAKSNGMKELWITCNPDNLASKRTCEKLGATYVNTVVVPPDSPMYAAGDRLKRRYYIRLR